MAAGESNPKSSIPISINYNHVDLERAERAAGIEGMELECFIQLATHEKAVRVIEQPPSFFISHAKPTAGNDHE